MGVKYLGESCPFECINGKVYNVKTGLTVGVGGSVYFLPVEQKIVRGSNNDK